MKPALAGLAAVGLTACLACSGDAAPSYVDVELGDEMVSVGVTEGPPDLTMGGVDDLVVGPHGDLFILDAKSVRVLRFSVSGEPLAGVGREGDGPDEFRWPAGIDMDAQGRLVVLSQAHQTLARFSVDADSLRFIDAPRLPFPARDLCFLGDRMYVLGTP